MWASPLFTHEVLMYVSKEDHTRIMSAVSLSGMRLLTIAENNKNINKIVDDLRLANSILVGMIENDDEHL
jgi:hypothetical protein